MYITNVVLAFSTSLRPLRRRSPGQNWPFKRLRGGRDALDSQLFEVRDHLAVLAVAIKSECRAAVNFNSLGVVDRKDLVADVILAVEKIMRRG